MTGPLDLRVLDATTGLAGGYCTKLLADAGADVILVEPAAGHPMRSWSATTTVKSGEDGALFQFLAAGKRSVVGDVYGEDASLEVLLAGADLLIEDAAVGMIEGSGVQARHPQLAVVSITPFGRGGPMSSRPGPEFIAQAESGGIACRGRAHLPPIHAGGRVGAWTAGSYAAPAAVAAAAQFRRSGRTEHVDVATIEVMAIAFPTFYNLSHSMSGAPPVEGRPGRSFETPSIEPAADGWVGFNTNTADQFQNFLLMIERPDLLDDAELNSLRDRVKRFDEFSEIVRAWTTRHSVAEILERAGELRIPVAQVHSAETLPTDVHLVARGVFVENPSGGFAQPRRPYKLDGDTGVVGVVPRIGEHAGQIDDRATPLAGSDNAPLPYEGVTILDMTSWWAGPSATHFFASLGADVVHVESTSHPDGMRLTGYMFGRPDWWEWGHMFIAANTNKRGITLDMKHPDGLALLQKLVAKADVVVENFAPRVAESFGLHFDDVQAINPDVIYVRMPAFGLDGPWRDRVGFAQTMEQMTGMAWLTGEVDDQPRIIRGPCDPIAGMHGALAIQAALAKREATGRGVQVESTMVEAALNCSAEQIVEFNAYGNVMQRAGNAGPYACPQGLFACSDGPESWLALAVETDAQWRALRSIVPALAEDREQSDAVAQTIATWAASRTVASAVDELVRAGVPAGQACDARVSSEHPQFAARGFFEVVDHPEVGSHPMPGMPYRWTSVERWLRSPSPTLGQHNDDVLREILDLSVEQIEQLASDGVIGTRPTGL